MAEKTYGVNCGVVEWVKRNKRQHEQARRTTENRLVKRVCQSTVQGMAGRGRPPKSWEGKVTR